MINALIKEYGQRLKLAGVPKAHQEAHQILRQILGERTVLDEKRKEAIEGAMYLRERRMPVERIFGTTEFYGLQLHTDKDVFKPYPETEDLVHYAVTKLTAEKPDARILDLGTGTGCVLLGILNSLPQATGIGVDLSEKAVAIANENAQLNGLQDRAEFRLGDWGSGITEKFDLVISNPPRAATGTIPFLLPEMRDYDPLLALDGGPDGLNFIRRLAEEFKNLGGDKAICMCQIGAVYAAQVQRVMKNAGFSDIQMNINYVGEPCCVTVRKPGPEISYPQVGLDMWKMMMESFFPTGKKE